MNNTNDTTLIDGTSEALRQLGLTVTALTKPPATCHPDGDACLRVERGEERIDYVVEAKWAVTPATIGPVLARLRSIAGVANRPVLLVTEYLTPPIAERLHAEGQPFADTVGNAYLEGPGLLVYVIGRKPKGAPRATTPGKTFTLTGLKVLFALICDPPLANAPHRAIAAAAGVALGAVPGVLADLRQEGHLLVAGKRRRLHGTKRLLDEWAFAYARKMRAKIMVATYTTPTFDAWQEWQLTPEEARWGGEPGANLLVQYLRPGVLTIYAENLPPRLMVEQRMVRAGRGMAERLVEVRKPFWGRALPVEGRTVPAVLVYADLLATGEGRCLETAQLVYEKHLAELLPAN